MMKNKLLLLERLTRIFGERCEIQYDAFSRWCAHVIYVIVVVIS